MPRTIELAPSILSANFADLAEHAKQALDGGGTLLHVDIMDGHFVPNLTIGPPVVASLLAREKEWDSTHTAMAVTGYLAKIRGFLDELELGED